VKLYSKALSIKVLCPFTGLRVQKMRIKNNNHQFQMAAMLINCVKGSQSPSRGSAETSLLNLYFSPVPEHARHGSLEPRKVHRDSLGFLLIPH
jgi:hypothetical protein